MQELTTQSKQEVTPWLLERWQHLTDTRKAYEWVDTTTENGYPAKAQRFIPPTPAEETELRNYLTELDSQLEPADKKIIIGLLGRLANHRQQDRTETEWRMLFEDYCDDLAEFSEAHIEQAIREHRRTSQWFPAIAQIRARCAELQELTKIRRSRCLRSLRGDHV